MPTNSKINWVLLGSIVTTISGFVGTVLTPIYGSALTSNVQGILQAVSGLLAAIGAFHVTSVAAANAKATHAVRLAASEKGLTL